MPAPVTPTPPKRRTTLQIRTLSKNICFIAPFARVSARAETRPAVPLRSRSRVGIETEPVSASRMPGPLSWTTLAKSAWEGNRLVVNIKRTIEGPSGPITIEMKDVYSVEGDALVIERTQGRDSWKTFYSRG